MMVNNVGEVLLKLSENSIKRKYETLMPNLIALFDREIERVSKVKYKYQ